ncbi:MAG: DUF1501 domain-containing protein [Thermoguttaceae bacterium]|jgi:hypothetical protein
MDSHWDRREFLLVTGSGTLGLGLAEGLARLALGEPQTAIPKARAKSVIGIYLEGGFTHIDTFDPKPNAPQTIRSFFKPIPTNVPGTEISELLPLMAKTADKYTIIRSMTAPGGGHGGYVMLCNAMNPKEAASTHPSAKLVYPCVGAVVGMKKVEDGGYKGDIPPWVCIPGTPWGGNNYGFLPPKYQGFCVGDPNDQYFRAPGVSLSPEEQKRFEKRRALLEAIVSGGKEKAPAAQTAEALRQSAFRLLSGDAKTAFDLSLEKKETRDRYGRHRLGQSCLLARRLAEYGVPFITVPWGGGEVQGSFGWDMHEQVNKTLRLLCPILDQAVSALFEDLAQRGTLKDTIVILYSESSKSPEWNAKPETLGGKHPGETGAGREHYNEVMCILVGGGGFKGGTLLGESDGEGRFVKSRPVYPWDLWESVYRLMGIDPNDRLPNPDGCVAYVSPATACSYARGGILTEIME